MGTPSAITLDETLHTTSGLNQLRLRSLNQLPPEILGHSELTLDLQELIDVGDQLRSAHLVADGPQLSNADEVLHVRADCSLDLVDGRLQLADVVLVVEATPLRSSALDSVDQTVHFSCRSNKYVEEAHTQQV